MKALAIVLLLVSVAWGGDYADTPHCSNSLGDCEPPEITSVTPCITVCVDWAELDKTTCECKVKKGHCPHCGAKGVDDGMGLQVIQGTKVMWTMHRCPNGHIFWEKE